jgi:Catalase-related immune-responsive/Catalase
MTDSNETGREAVQYGDQRVERGHGGETHQIAAGGAPRLTTQQGTIKRLGGPNFTHPPVNAPKCPVAHFQQDGHMAMANPQGRVNYEPNSWDPPGPREDPAAGFRSYPDGQGDQAGPKRRLRPESFADHYSQARQFYLSQDEVERQHLIDAFTFELSKWDKVAIRSRMVAGLRNVEEDLARSVGADLGLAELPDQLPPAREPVRDLAPSPALSMLANGPGSFAGGRAGQPDRRRVHQPERAFRRGLPLPLCAAAILAAPGQHRGEGGRRTG